MPKITVRHRGTPARREWPSVSVRGECRQDVFSRALDHQIDGRRCGCEVEVDFSGEGASPGRLMDEAGGRVNDRGGADREKQVTVAGGQRRLDICSGERFAEPDDRRPREAATGGAPRTASTECRFAQRVGVAGLISLVRRQPFVAPHGMAAFVPALQFPDRTVQPDQPPGASAHVQVIHVLCQHSAAFTCRPLGNDPMRGIGLAPGDVLAPPAIPLPDQRRIAPERAGRGEVFGPDVPPEPIGAAKRRNTARCRYSCAGKDGQTTSVTEPAREGIRYQGVAP